MKIQISLIGTLPPVTGVSDYCIQQTKVLSEKMPIEFFNFKAIYPKLFYKGKMTETDPTFQIPKNKNLTIHTPLTWYNPLSWIYTGLTAKGKIVHFHWWTWYLFPIFFTSTVIARLKGKKIVCTVHNILGHESNFFDKLFSAILFKVPHKFIVHTEQNKQQLQKIFKINTEKIEIIPHGIYDFYNDQPTTNEMARTKLNISKTAKTVLFFGYIRKYKGIFDLIDAFKIAQQTIPDLFLIIAGKPWNEEFKKEIEERAKKEKNIKLSLDYTPSSEIKYYFAAADLVVLPYLEFSAQSGPGNIALAFEKPLIVTNTGGLPELVLNKSQVVEPGNVNQLAEKIVDTFTEPNFLEKLENDSKILKKKFSWENNVEQTLKIYNQLLK
ncbi:MAG: glycosyltransferase family 4 protein [Candidatus Diapherotrites archaeon]|nr:glycosyltransferase family 4 protein [Candidatus Diapherotrites archaeon]